MATTLLQPPNPFSFDKPEEWSRWKRRFQQYRLASGLSEKTGPCQVSTLLYCMGETSEDVLNMTGISDKNKKNFDRVISKFDDHFLVRKNLIIERAQFNTMNQAKGESAELFITALHQAADKCEFGDIKDQMIRDRLVVGIRDRSLSERLQMEEGLTLDKAKRLIRQSESVKEQGAIQKDVKTEDTSMDSIHSRQQGHQRRKKFSQSRQPERQSQDQRRQQCRRCGRGSHPFQSCPARNATCSKCHRKGHFTSRCLSKTVAKMSRQMGELAVEETSDQEEGELYLDIIESDNSTIWREKITINKRLVTFKVDTGAEVTAIPESEWKTLKLPGNLQKSSRKLYTFIVSQQNC